MCIGSVWASADPKSSGASPTSTHMDVQPKAAVSPEGVERGPTQKAVEIARALGFAITNSMVVSWIVAVGLIVFAQAAPGI